MDRVTPEMITFMGKTAGALVRAAQSLTERACPTKKSESLTTLEIRVSDGQMKREKPLKYRREPANTTHIRLT
jgi:hypothetical protein